MSLFRCQESTDSVPTSSEDSYWQQPLLSQSKDIKLMVKRVFITNDLGEDALPKWASWVKVVVDGMCLCLFTD